MRRFGCERQQRLEVGSACGRGTPAARCRRCRGRPRAGGGRCAASRRRTRDSSMSIRMKLPRRAACATSAVDVLVGELLVEVEAEVGELERDVRAQLLVGDPVEHPLVRRRRPRGAASSSRPRRAASCSCGDPCSFRPRSTATPVEGLAGDEARARRAASRSGHEASDARVGRRGEDRAAKGGVDSRGGHVRE